MSAGTATAGRAMAPGGAAASGLRRAAMGPVTQTPRWYWPAVGCLGALVVVGLAAWVVQLRDGLSAAGYSDQAFWAVYEADLVTLIGVSYGGAVVSAILRLTHAQWRAPLTRIAEATALVTLPLGMLLILPHLGSPWRVWEFVWPPYWNLSSPILWDFFAICAYLLATVVFFYLPLVADLRIGAEILERGSASRFRRRLAAGYRLLAGRFDGGERHLRVLDRAVGLVAIMIIPMAVSVHSVLSFAFASSSRPGYAETIFPVYFVVAALYSGVALVIVVTGAARRLFGLHGFISDAHIVRLGLVMVAFGAAYLYLTFTEYLVDGYSGTAGSSAWVRQVVAGRYWPEFWFYVVGAGLVPILVLALRRTRKAKPVFAASALVVVAMWVKRLVIVIPAATEPLVTSPLSPTGQLAGGWGTYHFTWVSLSITVAFAAAVPLLLLLLFKVVPVLPMAEMERMEAEEAQSRPTPPAEAPLSLLAAHTAAEGGGNGS